MAVQAKINTEWAVRLALIAFMFLGGGFWFLYDGAVKWPRENQILAVAMDNTGYPHEDWQQRLESAGLPSNIDPLKLKPHSQWDLRTQFIIATICFPIGFMAALWLVTHRFKRLYADDQGVQFGSRRINYDQVTYIDLGRWDSKGIAVLHADGTHIKLDEWKFRGAGQILKQVQQRTGRSPS